MNWYIAKLVFKIATKPPTLHFQFDEHLRLIQAINEEEAILKARKVGLTEEDYFINIKEQAMREFVNVSEILIVAEIRDGAEVYSQIKEIEQGDEYIHLVHKKAAVLQGMSHSNYEA